MRTYELVGQSTYYVTGNNQTHKNSNINKIKIKELINYAISITQRKRISNKNENFILCVFLCFTAD